MSLSRGRRQRTLSCSSYVRIVFVQSGSKSSEKRSPVCCGKLAGKSLRDFEVLTGWDERQFVESDWGNDKRAVSLIYDDDVSYTDRSRKECVRWQGCTVPIEGSE